MRRPPTLDNVRDALDRGIPAEALEGWAGPETLRQALSAGEIPF